jgi:nucleoside 2-deoxyribosyltransferase
MANDDLKIYFCGSIRGGRADQELYKRLIVFLQNYGMVLTAHVGEENLNHDHRLESRDIYIRDMDWMKQADIVIAEVTTPSLGVGFEIATAFNLNKKILCLSRIEKNNLSAMISGCPGLDVFVYSNIEEAEKYIQDFLNSM